jgi:hypothetical protein
MTGLGIHATSVSYSKSRLHITLQKQKTLHFIILIHALTLSERLEKLNVVKFEPSRPTLKVYHNSVKFVSCVTL